jgi:HAD superfamily hydrolase (TIGR01490 family)
MINKIPNLAVFDFDGTITNVDTFNDIILLNFGRIKFYLFCFLISPIIFLYKLSILKNDVPKKILFKYFFGGMNVSKFKKICDHYQIRLAMQVKKDALVKIKYHQSKNDTVIINSASIFNWIYPWASNHKIHHILATEIEIKNNVVTGNFSTPCCYGAEKVNRLLHKFSSIKFDKIYAYGDSRGDKQLLKFSDFPNYKAFKG